ncbi:MAG: beta-galactosidase domain 4-containing protein [Muricoprocola sp.]
MNSDLDLNTGTGNTDVSVKLSGMADGYLAACLMDQAGEAVDSIFPIVLEEKMEFCLQVKNPHLWNAERPYLYTLVVEILDQNHETTERTTRRIPFYKWEILDGKTCLNRIPVKFKAEVWKDAAFLSKKADVFSDLDDEIFAVNEKKKVWQELVAMKKKGKNAVIVEAAHVTEELEFWCHICGIYLIVRGESPDAARLLTEYKAQLDKDGQGSLMENDFQMQVVQTGVMIENHSTFVNASEYELYYEIAGPDYIVMQGTMEADVPAGKCRFIELPFRTPDRAGEYRYLAALRLKEDTAWEYKGYVIAQAETMLCNIYENTRVKRSKPT